MALKITVDNDKYEIIESGSIIVNKELPFSMSIGEGENRLIITFTFIDDGDKRNLRTEKTGDKTLSIICENFSRDGEQWVGNGNFLSIGTINGKAIYLKLRTFFVANDLVFFYSWYKCQN